MQAYSIEYTVRSEKNGPVRHCLVDASSMRYALNKVARKHKVTRRGIKVLNGTLVGYY